MDRFARKAGMTALPGRMVRSATLPAIAARFCLILLMLASMAISASAGSHVYAGQNMPFELTQGHGGDHMQMMAEDHGQHASNHGGPEGGNDNAAGCVGDCCVFACSALDVVAQALQPYVIRRDVHEPGEDRRLHAELRMSDLRPPRA